LNFEREAVVDERALIRDGLRRGMGEITYTQVQAHLATRLASGEFQIVERPQSLPGRQFTTAKTIEAEHEILHRMRKGLDQLEPVLSRPQAIAVADQYSQLNRAQRTVIEDVLSSRDRIQGIQGYAGAGKTSTVAAIRSAAESRGYQVEGFAPTSRAARQLKEAGIEAGTIQAFLARTANPEVEDRKHFYLVDESSLASTNQIREFLSRLGAGDRVLLIGDIRQHQGVEAGRPFEQLQEAGMHTARLDEIVRQQDPALKSTVELLATGQVSAALEARGSKAIGIGAGTYASVVAIDPAANLLTVEKANHELAIYDPRRLTGVSVYQEIDRNFSIGERIQFTAPDKSLGVANRDLAFIESIHPDGRVIAGLSDSRRIEFNAREHPHFDHGYAVTSHSSQGLTAERVLVHADTSVHPDLLNSRFAYVSVSRASHDAIVFTDDLTKLVPQIETDVSKTSALGIDRGSPVEQGLGLGL
jgi:ATP-dependent exoDNAse (exonuclease V) alpha subunit